MDRPRRLKVFFDSGSAGSFIKSSVCRGCGAVYALPAPKNFGGLGNGRFRAHRVMILEVRLLGIWCTDAAFVVEDDVLDDPYDLLIGHGFMQKFGIRLDLRQKKAILNRGSLRMAQRVR